MKQKEVYNSVYFVGNSVHIRSNTFINNRFRECSRQVSHFFQATKALRESRDIALLSLLTSALEGVRGQRHAPAAFYPRERHGANCAGGWLGPRD
jgi:hypothetical protein